MTTTVKGLKRTIFLLILFGITLSLSYCLN